MKGHIKINPNASSDKNVDVRLVDNTLWLTEKQIAELFQIERSTVSKQIKSIFEEGELDSLTTEKQVKSEHCENMVQVYNLELIISLSFRVKSLEGIAIRRKFNEIILDHFKKINATKSPKLLKHEDLQELVAL